MKKKRNLVYIFLFALLIMADSGTVKAIGIVDNAYSSASKNYINTSHWERRRHSYSYIDNETRTEPYYEWEAVGRGDHGEEEGGGNNGSTAGNVPPNTADDGYADNGSGTATNFQPSRVRVKKTRTYTVPVTKTVVYYQYDYIYSSFYPNVSHGPATITKTPSFIYTKWHKKEDGSSANLDIQISIPGVYIDGYAANISHWTSYHNIVRYNGAGWETVYPATTVSGGRNGDYSYHVKYEYPHAGDETSTLYFTFTASVTEPRTFTTDQETGATTTYYYPVNVPITVAVKIPVNGFNSTDLREPEHPTNDLGFLGSKNYYSISY